MARYRIRPQQYSLQIAYRPSSFLLVTLKKTIPSNFHFTEAVMMMVVEVCSIKGNSDNDYDNDYGTDA